LGFDVHAETIAVAVAEPNGDCATLTPEYQTDQPSKKNLDRYPLYLQKTKPNINTNPGSI
jgi:hypothetical protein